MTVQENNKVVYDGTRRLSEQEKKCLKRRSIISLVLGILATLVGLSISISYVKDYIIRDYEEISGAKNISIFLAVIITVLTVYGFMTIYRAIKLIRYMNDICVTRVALVGISNNGLDHISYIGKFKCSVNGRKKTLEAPVFWGDVRRLRVTNYACLYYLSDRIWYLGRCIEDSTDKLEKTQREAKLILMDDNQKNAVLSVVHKKAISVMLKGALFIILVWIFVYVALNIVEIGENDSSVSLMLATMVSIITCLYFVECFIRNIIILAWVKKLRKNDLYWVVLPVRQCTCSINIFERWYRYAHYEYRGRMRRDWMIIGRNPINRVTCLISESDTSMPYGFMYDWFRGILY